MPDLWMDVDAALSEVPVNIMPLIDDTDFKSREVAIAYNAAGMDLVWNFVTPAGAFTQTAVTPTTGGNYDWAHQGDGMYSIEIPASGGASINNDTEGFGWFTGYCTGVLPWRGPTIGFRAAGLNDLLIESAYSATRGLAGTALPAAAADAAGGLPISDAGGLDLDTQIGTDIDAILVDTAVIGALGAGLTAIPWNAAWDAEVESEVDDALGGGTGTALTAVPWNAAWDAEVQSEVQDAIEANHLDHLLAADYDPASKPGVATALLNELVENDGGVSRFTANALEEAPTGGSAPSAADIADAVWDEVSTGHTDAGKAGQQLWTYLGIVYTTATKIDTAMVQDGVVFKFTANALEELGIGASGAGLSAIPWNAAWDAEVQSEAQDAIEANHLDHLLAADYDPASKPGVATALLNELVENDGGVSRFTANALEEAPTGGSAPSAADIADAVWDEVSTGHTDAGKAGEQLWTDVDAILVDTAVIGAAGAGLTAVPWNAAWDAEVESEVDDALGGGTGTALTAIPWNAAWDAEVESEVDDALGGGTGTALTAVPWNAAWDAEVQSEAQDAIEANHLDHLLAADYDPASKPGVATALLNELVENDGGVSRFTANALEQAPAAPSAADIVNEWETQSQADPTGFHVNVMEVGGTAQTANDNGADINAILADTGTDGVALSTAVKQAIADEILKRGIANVEDAADATSLAALVLAAFESAISGSTWTIYKTNHATTFTTRQVTSSAGADPITEVT